MTDHVIHVSLWRAEESHTLDNPQPTQKDDSKFLNGLEFLSLDGETAVPGERESARSLAHTHTHAVHV